MGARGLRFDCRSCSRTCIASISRCIPINQSSDHGLIQVFQDEVAGSWSSRLVTGAAEFVSNV
jgi:hypothetical protein